MTTDRRHRIASMTRHELRPSRRKSIVWRIFELGLACAAAIVVGQGYDVRPGVALGTLFAVVTLAAAAWYSIQELRR